MATKITRDGGATSRLDERRRSANEASNEPYATKQREIIETAVRLFAEKGYDATSLGDIAKAVEMDRATLYYYFKSKTHLLSSAISDVLSGAANELYEIADSDDDALSKLRAAIRCIVTAMAEKYPFSALYYQDDIWRPPRNSALIAPLRKDHRRITRAFDVIINDGQRDGTIRDDVSADLINRVVFGSIAWSYRWYKPESGHSIEEAVHAFDAILSVGVAPPKRPAKRRQQRESTSRRDVPARS
jgi:AcrR family transcriptional regulator